MGVMDEVVFEFVLDESEEVVLGVDVEPELVIEAVPDEPASRG